ncbi:VOC family protein [Trinickia sp. LjRoot230]|uniref:4-hydroxyphenylpyruvate dioxygenase family protein n=1 Tax=Trinickia sp. LjRoot230 TaxID=3342288 RepID=UPI003ECE719A
MSPDLSDPSSSAHTASPALPNPLGIAGLEFVEFAAPAPEALAQRFAQLGFAAAARHVSKDVTLYRQGEMNFLINAEPDSFAARYAQEYGAGICAIGVRVDNAQRAFERATERGAWAFDGERVGQSELVIPAIQGIGNSHIYFVDRWRGRGGATGDETIFDIDFRPLDTAVSVGQPHAGTHQEAGLREVDHFTQMVGAGRIAEWLDFYRDMLDFREIRELHADWHLSADSRVMQSPCGGITIPLYEEGTQRTRLLHDYLPDHPGEGVQHIALATDNILECIDHLAARGVELLQPPPRYYDELDARLTGHGLDIDALRRRNILVDGEIDANGAPRLFLQTFIKRAPDEIFFEIVERRGHHGFGEGNLQALERARAPR